MTVLTNTMLQGTSADTDEESYQIEKSLRFNDDDSAYIHKSLSATGNQRIWTFAAWIKTHAQPSGNAVNVKWLTTSYQNQVQLLADGTISINWHGNTHKLQTNSVFRDPSAWFHLVIVTDTPNNIAADRLRIYINGKRETSFSTATYPDQNDKSDWNEVGKDVWIGRAHDAAQYGDGYLADVHFIDGLALSPAAFGSFDSTGVWNPKEFSIPAPNDGTDWSDTTANSSGGSLEVGPKANLFDGSITGDCQIGSNDGHMTLTTGTFPLKATLRFHQRGFTSYQDKQHTLQINDDYYYWYLSAENSWFDIPLKRGYDKVTTFKYSFAGAADKINAIEVDGVILIDNQTDATTRNNPNNGTVWSSAFTGGSFASGNGATLAFDGLTSTMARPDQSQTITWTAPTSIAFNKLEFCGWNDNISDGVVVNGVNISSTIASAAAESFTDITSLITSPLSTIVLKGDSGTNKASFRAVRIDGHILIDSTVDNSFHLKFNDTSTQAALGNNSILSSVNSPVTAGAILKVKTNSTDFALDSGVNSDPDKSHLVLAIAGNTIADHSHTIKGSGSAVSLTSNGSIATSSAQSKFYGTSIYFDGSDDYIDTDAIDTDANSKFCVEYWMRTDVLDGCRPFNGSDNLNGTAYLYTELLATGGLKCRQADLGIIEAAAGTISANTWHHIAYTYDGTTERLFIDGVLKASDTSGSWTPPSDMKFRLGADESNAASGKYKGYLQDARVYFGTAKYTAAFTPAPGNFTVNNLNAAGIAGHTGPWNTGFKKDSRTSWSSADDWTPSSGDTVVTNGNNTVLYIDRESLGDAFSITLEHTAGANDIYMAESDDGSSWSATYNNQNKIILTESSSTYISTSGTTTDVTSSIKRYLRPEGAGGGQCTMTITGTAFGEPVSQTDSLVDTPTNYEPEDGDTGVGGEVRGNYCTWNSLDAVGTWTLKEGNLSGTGNDFGLRGTIAPSTGKWYYETTIAAIANGGDYGIVDANETVHKGDPGAVTHGWSVHTSGAKRNNNNTTNSYVAAYATGDIVNVAWDIDAGKVWFGKNGTWGSSGNPATGANAAFTNVSGRPAPAIGNGGSSGFAFDTNFGQRAFKYTAPSGYKCLCTQNLPDTFSGDELNNPSKYFGIKKYTGDDTTDGSKKVKFSFSPDLVWLKCLSTGYDHRIFDRIRGQGSLVANKTDAEYSDAASSLTTFDSDGISIENTATETYNKNGETYIAWAWDAGTAVTNYGATDNGADIACAVWKNPTAGFSIVNWTSDAGSSNSFMNHGLGTQPDCILIRNVTSGSDWIVLHHGLGTSSDDIRENHLVLNTTAAMVDKGSEYFERASNNVFGLRHDIISSSSSDEMIAYCWTAIPGYSVFGKYTGNGAEDGSFVYTGFKPRYILLKKRDGTAGWPIIDSERCVANRSAFLYAHDHAAEFNNGGGEVLDFAANGFKHRDSGGDTNGSSTTYIYAAFAENPFKTARAF